MTRLLAPIIALQNTLEALIQACPEETSPYLPHVYAFLRRNIQRFHGIMAPFGHNETLDWVMDPYRDRVTTLFTMIVVHTQLLSSDRSGLVYTPDQQAHIDEMDRLIGQISQILFEMLDIPRQFYTLQVNDRHLALMCELALREELSYIYINVVIPPNLPPIAHYPLYTLHLMSWFIGHFHWQFRRPNPRAETATVKARAEENGVAIVITFVNLRLDPVSWERFISRHSIEPLYELGGRIEPLVWNEGEGQGMILRLPWAKS